MSKFQVYPVVITPTFSNTPDAVLANIWYDLFAEDKTDILFYDGMIKTVDQWLAFIKAPWNFPVICHDSDHIVAIAWLNNLDNAAARCHFAFIDDFQRDAGKAIINYWSGLKTVDEKAEPIFKVLYGITPETNKLAVRVIKIMGFTIIGTIPYFCKANDELVGGILSYYCPKDNSNAK
jgi:hypothetical protein